jgi:hypothetical protein
MPLLIIINYSLYAGFYINGNNHSFSHNTPFIVKLKRTTSKIMPPCFFLIDALVLMAAMIRILYLVYKHPKYTANVGVIVFYVTIVVLLCVVTLVTS